MSDLLQILAESDDLDKKAVGNLIKFWRTSHVGNLSKTRQAPSHKGPDRRRRALATADKRNVYYDWQGAASFLNFMIRILEFNHPSYSVLWRQLKCPMFYKRALRLRNCGGVTSTLGGRARVAPHPPELANHRLLLTFHTPASHST